jgi:hypothetical protein
MYEPRNRQLSARTATRSTSVQKKLIDLGPVEKLEDIVHSSFLYSSPQVESGHINKTLIALNCINALITRPEAQPAGFLCMWPEVHAGVERRVLGSPSITTFLRDIYGSFTPSSNRMKGWRCSDVGSRTTRARPI